jgi:hypothetical protein
MIKKKRSIVILAIFIAFMATVLLFSGLIRAGDLNPLGSPDSTMHTLDEIYDKVKHIYTYFFLRLARPLVMTTLEMSLPVQVQAKMVICERA